MPVRKITLNKVQAVQAFNLLGHVAGSRGQRYHLNILLGRFKEVWWELYPENGANPETVSADEKREVTFTPEEQNAVAMGLTDLAASVIWPVPLPDGTQRRTVANDVAHVLKVAKTLGSGIHRYVETNLQADKVDPFDGKWDEDPDPTKE